MKFAIKHLWSSLRDLATQSPILLALIAIFSCTPLYIEQDWFAEIDIKLYSLYFFIVILQSYITRARKFSILYTLVSIGISVGLYMIHESYGYVRGIELATENISYLWLYSFLRYSHPLIYSFVYLWYVLTKRIPQVLQHQTHFLLLYSASSCLRRPLLQAF